MKRFDVLKGALFCLLVLLSAATGADPEWKCAPTRPDMLGPFYEPGAPERSVVGEGYVLTGVVRSAQDCSPVAVARIEFWLTGPHGQYDDDHRATVIAGEGGSYTFQSNHPPGYYGRPPHIHIRVTAGGFRTLVTQHYPERGKTEGLFDLVLEPVTGNTE